MRIIFLLWTSLSFPSGIYAESDEETHVLKTSHFNASDIDEHIWWVGYDGEKRTGSRFIRLGLDAKLEVSLQHSSPDILYIGRDETLQLTITSGGKIEVISVFLRYRHFGSVDVFNTKGGTKIGMGFCYSIFRCELNFVNQGKWIIMDVDDHSRDDIIDASKQRIDLSIAQEDDGYFTWFGKPMKLIVFAATLHSSK